MGGRGRVHKAEQRRAVLGDIAEAEAQGATLKRSCEVVGVSTNTVRRWRQQQDGGNDGRRGPNTVPGNKLSEHEEKRLLKLLTTPEHRDLSPRQVIPAMAERGVYIASEATAYRLLHKHGMQKNRTNKRSPTKKKPDELVADAPDQVYCWDITYLRRSILGTFFYLYMVSDIFSRRIVAARVHEVESDELATALFTEVQKREGLEPGQTALHSDNGAVMKGATLIATLQRLGVMTSYSRPRVSDDNPFIESLFSTMKTRVGYPKKPFETVDEAQAWVDSFVVWYNEEHRHSALNWVTPMARHTGEDLEQLRRREATYRRARQRNPQRWSGAIRNCSPAPPVKLNPARRTPVATASGS